MPETHTNNKLCSHILIIKYLAIIIVISYNHYYYLLVTVSIKQSALSYVIKLKYVFVSDVDGGSVRCGG